MHNHIFKCINTQYLEELNRNIFQRPSKTLLTGICSSFTQYIKRCPNKWNILCLNKIILVN